MGNKQSNNNADIQEAEVIEQENKSSGIIDPLLSGQPKQRDYTSGQPGGGESINEVIPEQNFDVKIEDINIEDNQQSPKEPDFDTSGLGNQQLQDAPKKTKLKGVEYYADTIIAGYEVLHDIARERIKLTDDKLYYKAITGKINLGILNVEFPLDEHDPSQVITFDGIRQELNNTVDQTLIVTQEFKEEVRPVLIEVLMERNMGMTAMDRLKFMALEDIAPKIGILFTMNNKLNKLMNIATAQYKDSKKNQSKSGYTTTPPPQEENKEKTETENDPKKKTKKRMTKEERADMHIEQLKQEKEEKGFREPGETDDQKNDTNNNEEK